MGCYWLTAARGEGSGEVKKVEAGDGMVFHSPPRLFRAHAEHKLGLHARIQVRCRPSKRVLSEVRNERGRRQWSRRSRASRTGWCGRPSAGSSSTTSCNPKMAFYDLALSSKYLSRVISRLLPGAGPPGDHRACSTG